MPRNTAYAGPGGPIARRAVDYLVGVAVTPLGAARAVLELRYHSTACRCRSGGTWCDGETVRQRVLGHVTALRLARQARRRMLEGRR